MLDCCFRDINAVLSHVELCSNNTSIELQSGYIIQRGVIFYTLASQHTCSSSKNS